MKIRKYLLTLVAVLIASVVVFAACTRNGDDDGAAADFERIERHLRLPWPLPNTTIFNPMTIANEHEVTRLLHVNLYARIVCPIEQWPILVLDIAADYPQQMDEEGYVWRHFIQPGHTFNNGAPINAHNFEAAIRWQNDPLLLNRNSGQHGFVGGAEFYMGEIAWEEVTGFRLIDDYTFEITHVNRPELGLVSVMGGFAYGGNAPIYLPLFLQNLAADGTSTSWGRTPFYPYFMGAGPFMGYQYITDQIITFVRNPNYTGPLADIFTADRMSWIVAPDESTQTMLFQNRELDQARANSREFDEHPGLFSYPNGFIYGIFLNSYSETNPILQDINFRRALYWSLDRERIVGAAFPTHVPQAFLFPITTRLRAYDFLETGRRLNYRETYGLQVNINGHPLTQNGFNVDLALHYFELAFVANGSVPLSIEVIYSDAGEAEQMWAEAIQEAWQNTFGIDRLQINLRSVPWAVALEQHLFRTMMDYEIMATRRIWMVLDGEPWWNTNWVSDDHRHTWEGAYAILTPENFAEFDRIFDIAYFANRHTHEDRNLRNQTAADVEQLILNDHSFIPMYNHNDRLMISPWLQTIMPNGHYSFRLGPFQFIWDDEMNARMNADD